MNLLTNMLWFDKKSVDLKHLKEQLTLYAKRFKGGPQKVNMLRLTGSHVGVPRAWGLRQGWLPSEYDDRTTEGSSVVWTPIAFPEGKNYWTGQKESVEAICEFYKTYGNSKHGALLESPCGSGKTLMAMDIASRLGLKTLIVVHKGDLGDQWHDTGKNFFGLKGGHCQRDKWDWEDRAYTTIMAQTLYRRMGELPIGFLRDFGLVIYDEGHRYPARTFEQILGLFPSKFRLAVSATWKRSDGLEAVWNWHIGRIEHRTKIPRLVGEYMQIPWTTNITDKMMAMYDKSVSQSKWCNAMATNAKYNVWLADRLAEGSQEAGRTLLCVSDRIAHLEDLRVRLLKKGCSVGLYIGGKTKAELKVAASCRIILATYGMMAEGTDIPELDTLVFATPRAEVEQVIGRIQRPKDKKRVLVIVDPVFSTGYNIALSKKRLKVYAKLGFVKRKTDG